MEDKMLIEHISFCYMEPVWRSKRELETIDQATVLLYGRFLVNFRGFRWVKQIRKNGVVFGVSHPMCATISLDLDDIRLATDALIEEGDADDIDERMKIVIHTKLPDYDE